MWENVHATHFADCIIIIITLLTLISLIGRYSLSLSQVGQEPSGWAQLEQESKDPGNDSGGF